MNTVGLSLLLRMGCVCGKETITINNRRFIVRERIGDGGFSVMDMLEEARTHRLFALKRITCHEKKDERVAMQEVEIMRSFRHKNIVPLEEHAMITIGHHNQTFETISEVLIVMPYYRKGSLQDWIDALAKKSNRIPETQIWTLFLEICKGVKAMHSFNPPYAHRDLKPGNVMIADDESPVLMDLGSATKARVEVKTRSEAQALQDEAAERCSMLYRPPELFTVETGTNVDERTDIWSLGCLLYAMAFLESPFEKVYQRGDSIALAVLGRTFKIPEHSGYSKNVEEVIFDCMVVNPMERPFIDQILQKVDTLHKQSSSRL